MENENLKPSRFDRLCESFSNFSFFGPSRHLIYKQTNPINNQNENHLEDPQVAEDAQGFAIRNTNN